MESLTSKIKYHEILLTSFLAASLVNLTNSVACDGAESCIFKNITSTNSSDIDCNGYRSCEESPLILSNHTGNINCEGSFSCYNAQNIMYLGTSGSIFCNGLFSCAKVSNIIQTGGTYTNCMGEQSCANSNIITQASQNWGGGDLCFFNANVTLSDTMLLRGRFSGYNATFYSGDDSIRIRFFGAYSGYNATVNCQNGHACSIQCYGNACNNLNLIGNGTFRVLCDYSEYFESCPNGYNVENILSGFNLDVDIDDFIPKLLNVSMSTFENSFDICIPNINSTNTSTNAFICDDSQECYNRRTIDTSDILAPICCLAYESCTNVTQIKSIHPAISNHNSNAIIRCDATSSCELSTNAIGANLFTTAFRSTFDVSSMQTTNADYYDIFITGARSGTNIINLSNARNLYCIGAESCRYASMISNITNIFGYGYFCVSLAKVIDVGNIYCGAYASCYQTIIENVQGSVHGSGYQVLKYSTIRNVSNNLIAVGYECLNGSTIVGIHGSIAIHGYGAVGNATIISESNFDQYGLLNIKINGTNNQEYSIYCNSTDRCNIKCQSTNACTNAKLYCFGECFVDCNETYEIDCPIAAFGNYSSYIFTSYPTNQPSNLYTFISTSTIEQSGVPTSVSTTVPTSDPTSAPTGSPTETVIPQTIYLYYDESIDELSLSLATYANELMNATLSAMRKVLNDTKLSTVCNGTDSNGIDCYLSNYNPFTIDDNENRRIMLNDKYSYKLIKDSSNNIDVNQGWWQARIENLHFCVVLGFEWDPNVCDSYDESRFQDDETFATVTAEHIAFGTFDLVADENIDLFEAYFYQTMNQSSTRYIPFDTMLNHFMNNLLFHDNFNLVSYTIERHYDSYQDEKTDQFEQVAYYVTYGLYGFMIFCVLMATISKLKALHSGADNVRSMRIILFGIWTWDFVSDLIFGLRAVQQEYYTQGIICLVFVFIPLVINVMILVKSQQRWTTDTTTKFVVSAWLLKHNTKLIILTVMCGSAFAAVHLCNSNTFDLGFFRMGLTERHLQSFNGNRLYSNVILENLPQLAIQIWYFISRNDSDTIAVLAFLSSVASIFITFIDVYSTLSLLKAMKTAQKGGYFEIESYFVDIIGSTITRNRHLLKRKPNAMTKIFGEILEVNRQSVECNAIVNIDNGLQYHFAFCSLNKSNKKGLSIDNKMNKIASSRVERLLFIFQSLCCKSSKTVIARIVNDFELNDLNDPENVDIAISNITTFYDCRQNDFLKDYQYIVKSSLYLNNSQMFSFEKLGIFQTVCINSNVNGAPSIDQGQDVDIMQHQDDSTSDEHDDNDNDAGDDFKRGSQWPRKYRARRKPNQFEMMQMKDVHQQMIKNMHCQSYIDFDIYPWLKEKITVGVGPGEVVESNTNQEVVTEIVNRQQSSDM